MSTPEILTPATLLTHSQPSIANANNLLDQARRAEVKTQEDFDKIADAVKVCIAQEKMASETLGRLIDPLTAHVSWIRQQFAPIFETIADAKAMFKAKGLVWSQAEADRRAAEQEALRKKAEDQAIADAEAARAAGDNERAEQLLELAATTPIVDPKIRGRGGYTGASAGTKKTWKGEVVDVKAFCKAIADGTLSETLIDVSKISKTKLNGFADNQRKEGVFHGIRVVEQQDLNVR